MKNRTYEICSEKCEEIGYVNGYNGERYAGKIDDTDFVHLRSSGLRFSVFEYIGGELSDLIICRDNKTYKLSTLMKQGTFRDTGLLLRFEGIVEYLPFNSMAFTHDTLMKDVYKTVDGRFVEGFGNYGGYTNCTLLDDNSYIWVSDRDKGERFFGFNLCRAKELPGGEEHIYNLWDRLSNNERYTNACRELAKYVFLNYDSDPVGQYYLV